MTATQLVCNVAAGFPEGTILSASYETDLVRVGPTIIATVATPTPTNPPQASHPPLRQLQLVSSTIPISVTTTTITIFGT